VEVAETVRMIDDLSDCLTVQRHWRATTWNRPLCWCVSITLPASS